MGEYGSYFAMVTGHGSPTVRGACTCAKGTLVRPLISELFDQLVVRHRESRRIDLDDIAEVIGTRAVSYDEVDHLVERLESEGFSVGEGIDESDVETMRRVLEEARQLRVALGRTPTVDEIAAAVGKPVYAVRRALERAGGKVTGKRD